MKKLLDLEKTEELLDFHKKSSSYHKQLFLLLVCIVFQLFSFPAL